MIKLKFDSKSDVVFTTYFSSKNNPQPDLYGNFHNAPRNSISYIYGWYISVLYLKLNAVIIHDGLDADFISKYESDNLQFVYYEPSKYSLNDERYIAFKSILESNKFNRVMLTDGSDLIFKKNPFEYANNPNQLYFGTDQMEMPTIKDNPWCINKLIQLMQAGLDEITIEPSFLEFNYVNAGVFGGGYDTVREFNDKIVELILKLSNSNNNNMMIINYLLWRNDLKFESNYPFTSRFKKYDFHDDCYIIHK